MAVDRSHIGESTGASRCTVERGPVANFAVAVKDENPVYADLDAARAGGFDGIPAPPTFTFALQHWGKFAEQQPPDPTGGQSPMLAVMGGLMSKGGLILHGEQEFVYHRPVVSGDVLSGEGKLVDIYEKESKGRTMTFIVMETVWSDDRTGDPVVTERFNLIHRS